MGERVRKHVVVRGRVQGVFFRETTRRAADAADVAGWVANRSDGSVEAVFEGEPAAVERMVDFCRRGPSRADVDAIDISDEQPQQLARFDVR